MTFVVKYDRDDAYDGWFCAEDVVALSAIKVLKRAIEVAEDSSLVYAALIAEAKAKLQLEGRESHRRRAQGCRASCGRSS